MVTYEYIILINKDVTNRPLSEDAALYLYNACRKYADEGKNYRGHYPYLGITVEKVKELLSKFQEGEGDITLSELALKCEEMPYPFNFWLC